MTDLPITARVEPRPVWARRIARLEGAKLSPPTEDEIGDAFRVLEQGVRWPASMYAEAELITWEASEQRAIGTKELRARYGDTIPFEELYPQ